jgi:signal transduction histidine kinase
MFATIRRRVQRLTHRVEPAIPIFEWGIFPVAFQEATGLTAFKVGSEYFFAALMLGAALLVVYFRRSFERPVRQLLVASIATTMLAELTFTLYSSPFDAINLLGHLLRFVSFYLMLRAVIEMGRRPYSLLFRDLRERELRLEQQTRELRERNEDLDAFAHTIAHELGDPLASISTAAAALRSQQFSQGERSEYLQGIMATSQKMGRIIDGLLALAKVRRAQSGSRAVGHG